MKILKLILPVVALMLIVFGVLLTDSRLATPNAQKREDMEWLQQEATTIFGKSGGLAPQKATYNCDLPTKIFGGCYIHVSSQFIYNNAEIKKYLGFADQLPTQLLSNGWSKYKSQFPTPETIKNSSGDAQIYIAYTKTNRRLYCELLFTAQYSTHTEKSLEPAGWNINCRQR